MVEHVNIGDTDRHEAKGASTAALNQVLHSDGDGTTSFKFIDYSNLLNTPDVTGYSAVLQAYSGATQNPVALDTPLKVNFGSPQASASVSLSGTGDLTFLQSGEYAITLFLRFGRTAGGGNAITLSRFLINGVQGLNSNAISMPDAASIVPFSTTLYLNAVAGQVFTLEIMRDSAGINNGGLTALTPTVGGWNVAPSATIIVNKFGGLS